MKGLKKYLLEFDESLENVFAVSLVQAGAVKNDFIFLSDEEVKLQVTNDEKRLVTGVLLKPNFPMYRAATKDFPAHYIEFTEDTIELASQQYLKDFNQGNVTVHHEEEVGQTTLTEQWIVSDPKNDKANSLGFNVPKGTWMITLKIDNDELWTKIKNGEVRAFSLEGRFNRVDTHQELSLTNNKSNMATEELNQEVIAEPAGPVETIETAPENETQEPETETAEEAVTLAERATSAAQTLLSRVREVVGISTETVEAAEDPVVEAEEPTYVSVEAFNELRSDVDALMEAVTMLLENYTPAEPTDPAVTAAEEVQAEEETPEEEVQMVSLSEGKEQRKSPKITYKPGQTIQERIKAGLGIDN